MIACLERHSHCWGLMLLLSFMVFARGPATAQYHIRALGTLPGATASRAFAINASGQVTGTSGIPNGWTRAFLWSAGTMSDLGVLGTGTQSNGMGINDSGQVSGYSDNGDLDGFLLQPVQRAFVSGGDGLQDLGIFGGPYGFAVYTYGYGVNSQGNVAVGSNVPDSWSALVYSPSRDQLVSLGPLVSGGLSWAYGINDSNQVVGFCSDSHGNYRATLWNYGESAGTVISRLDLGTIDGQGVNSKAYGVNALGHVVGQSDSYDFRDRAFLWRDGAMTALGSLPGLSRSIALAASSSDAVVGYAYNSDVQSTHRAFLWSNGAMFDLNTLIPVNTGWVLCEAYGINERGQIVGWGYQPGTDSQAFLLSPNSPPLAANDQGSTPGNTSVILSLLSNDSDPDGDTLTLTAVGKASFGTVTSSIDGTVTYTPNLWAGGTDHFAYTIGDGYGGTATASVSVLVCAADVTREMRLTTGKASVDRKTGLYQQSVSLTNTGLRTIPTPISLVLDNLTKGVTLVNRSGTTLNAAPAASPFIQVSSGKSGTIGPGQTIKGTLQFSGPNGLAISYTPRLLAGSGSR